MSDTSILAMLDMLIVGVIVAAAGAFVLYRYVFKKSGGCSCGSESCCSAKKSESKCGCSK